MPNPIGYSFAVNTNLGRVVEKVVKYIFTSLFASGVSKSVAIGRPTFKTTRTHLKIDVDIERVCPKHSGMRRTQHQGIHRVVVVLDVVWNDSGASELLPHTLTQVSIGRSRCRHYRLIVHIPCLLLSRK